MTTAERAEELANRAEEFAYIGRDIAAALRELAEIRRQEEGRLQWAKCSACGSVNLRASNVTSGCCAADRQLETWQMIACMDCGQDNGIAHTSTGQRLLAHAELPDASSRPVTADEITMARAAVGDVDAGSVVEIPPDARAWETDKEIRIEASVLVRMKR